MGFKPSAAAAAMTTSMGPTPSFDAVVGTTAPPPKISYAEERDLRAEQRRQKMEQELGETIGIHRRSLQELHAAITEGVMVKVNISRWRFGAKLNADELGLVDASSELSRKEGEKVCQQLRLGQKLLLPTEVVHKVDAVESMVRALLRNTDSGASGIKLGDGWFFLPTERFKVFREKFKKLRGDYFARIQEIADDLPKYHGYIRDTFRPLADKAWISQRAKWEEEPHGVGHFTHHPSPTPKFIEAFLASLVAQVPTSDEIMAEASMSYQLNIYEAPEARLAREYVKSDPEVQDELYEQMQNRKQTLFDDFFIAARNTMADAIRDHINKVRKAVGHKPTVHPKTVAALLKTLADLKDLNQITNDREISEILDSMERFVNQRSAAATATGDRMNAGDVLHMLSATMESLTALPDINTDKHFGAIE